MSAAYSIALEKLGTQPGYVVAGSLYIGDKRIFGDDKEFDGKVLFSKSNPDWNGHAWIVYGDYLADVSVFRTADAGSPRLLSKHVAKEYGRGRGFCAWPMARMDPTGLQYVPQYALTQDQAAALMRGALVMIEQIDAKRDKK
jgi:hypothetical protein